MIDSVDHYSLEYESSALHSAVQTIHMVGLVKHSTHIVVEISLPCSVLHPLNTVMNDVYSQ